MVCFVNLFRVLVLVWFRGCIGIMFVLKLGRMRIYENGCDELDGLCV